MVGYKNIDAGMVPFSVIVQRILKHLSILIITAAIALAGNRERTIARARAAASQKPLQRDMSVTTLMSIEMETGAFGV